MTTVSSEPEMLVVAFDVARRLKDYGSYGGSEAKACKAISRRSVGFQSQQYEDALFKAVRLYEVTDELVERYKEQLWRTYETPQGLDVTDILEEAERLCPGFSASTYNSAIWWLFFWHHLK